MRWDSLLSLIHRRQCDTMQRALSAQKLLLTLNKGETVDAAGSTRGACWSSGVVVGLWRLTPKSLYVFVC